MRPANLVGNKSSPLLARTTVGWGPIKAIVFTVSSYFLAQISAAALLGAYVAANHLSKSQIDSFTAKPSIEFLLMVLVELVTVGLIYWLLKSTRTPARLIGLIFRFKISDVGYALAGYAVYFLVYGLAIFLLRTITAINLDQAQDLGFSTATHGSVLIIIFVSLVILPPLVEETLFRGVLYSGLRRKWSVGTAMIITSGLFALAHLQLGSGAAPLWIAAVDTFILSVILVNLRERTGSLMASMMLHGFKNGIAFLALFVFKLA